MSDVVFTVFITIMLTCMLIIVASEVIGACIT